MSQLMLGDRVHTAASSILMVLLEKPSLPRQSGGGVFHQASVLQLLPPPQLLLAYTLSPGHPGSQWAVKGAALQLLLQFSGIPGRALGDYTAVIWD